MLTELKHESVQLFARKGKETPKKLKYGIWRSVPSRLNCLQKAEEIQSLKFLDNESVDRLGGSYRYHRKGTEAGLFSSSAVCLKGVAECMKCIQSGWRRKRKKETKKRTCVSPSLCVPGPY